MMLPRISALMIALLISGCVTVSDRPSSERQKYSHVIGWVHAGCLAIHNDELNPGDKIRLHSADRRDITQTARISHRARSGEECMALRPERKDINLLTGASFYVIAATNAPELAVATTGDPGLTYRYCLGNKGVTFMADDGEKNVWQGYYFTAQPQPSRCSR